MKMDNHMSTSAIDRFCRQYLQLHQDLDYPGKDTLRDIEYQEKVYQRLFQKESITYPPPQRYQLRVLKELLKRIETSIQNWDEEELSDNLFETLSSLMSSNLPLEVHSAQQKAYVTYTVASLPHKPQLSPTITLYEARNIISASGTTGLRTWEATLHLGNYLVANSDLVDGKSVMELGAGTGYVSILCAKHLGASYALATDGSEEVVDSLHTNTYLNDLQETTRIESKELKWGYPLTGGEEATWNRGRRIDLVVGADLTYYETGIPALVATFGDLFELFPDVKIVIASIIRNPKTFDVFTKACAGHGYLFNEIEFPMTESSKQEGPFYEAKVPIKIASIAKG
ncbi:putative methyltransferase-domain-containing protein [Amylocarpus encephaloides]|uniref:Methyltransferase-domain-containing protein n=1 Tax=Amylocarpus encephaloides TaxID=45428 RepID=A0A9P8C2W1_9HELO|nr:putative methyltransferase-domain-containing protein [Amylocarpus encephaloides]